MPIKGNVCEDKLLTFIVITVKKTVTFMLTVVGLCSGNVMDAQLVWFSYEVQLF